MYTVHKDTVTCTLYTQGHCHMHTVHTQGHCHMYTAHKDTVTCTLYTQGYCHMYTVHTQGHYHMYTVHTRTLSHVHCTHSKTYCPLTDIRTYVRTDVHIPLLIPFSQVLNSRKPHTHTLLYTVHPEPAQPPRMWTHPLTPTHI